ncbi:ATP-binding protein [Streptomyces sp. T028]|uniref:ATP-binding protein n=1 Tax=Streptomyces sp. T028 TaxID=3394379 RepID=UPI003A85BDF4
MIHDTATPDARSERPVRDFSVLLSSTPRGARLGRLLAVEQLRSWGLPLDPARQIVAELAANAAVHGRIPGRDFRLSLYVLAGTLRIEVTDTHGDRLPLLQDPAADAESGRGLLLVDALADRWGVTSELCPRKTVWAEVQLAPEPDRPCFGARGGLFSKDHGGEMTRPSPTPPARRASHSRE